MLIGTSNCEGIKADKLTNTAQVKKIIKYHTEEAADYISIIKEPPTLLVLHILTNDVKKYRPQQCVDNIFKLTANTCAKWPDVKIIISSPTTRCDNMNNSTNGQITGVLLKQKFAGVDNIHILEHSNMHVHGNPNKDLLRDDGYHLNDKGLSFLAMNLKRDIHSVLEVPLPARRPRSTSRQRRPNRGRGRVRGVFNGDSRGDSQE